MIPSIQQIPTDTKKYKIVSSADVPRLDFSLLLDDPNSLRYNIDRTEVIIEYISEIEDGMTNQEIIDFVNQNYFDWNETDPPEIANRF